MKLVSQSMRLSIGSIKSSGVTTQTLIQRTKRAKSSTAVLKLAIRRRMKTPGKRRRRASATLLILKRQTMLMSTSTEKGTQSTRSSGTHKVSISPDMV
jgi:hypothetical protein